MKSLSVTLLFALLAACQEASPSGAPDGGPAPGSPDALAPTPDADAMPPDATSPDAGGACPSPTVPTVVEEGHTALGIGHTDVVAVHYDCATRRLGLTVADGTAPLSAGTDTHRPVENVLIHGGPDAILLVPDPADVPGFEFLGAPGAEVWVLPQTQIETVVWPGFQVYGVGPGVVLDEKLTLRLLSVAGPGSFFAFVDSGVPGPPEMIFDLGNDLRDRELHVGLHAHLNWAFTAPGLYELTFEARATAVDGAELTSPARTYRFWLGALADLPATAPTLVAVSGLAAGYAQGDEMVLSPAQFGAPSALEAHWFRQCYLDPTMSLAVGPWEELPSVAGVLTTTVVGGCQYRVSLMDGMTPVATSQAVTPSLL